MRTLIKEVVAAIAVPKIIESSGLRCRGAGLDDISINQDLN